MTLIFDPSRSSKVKGDGANLKPVGGTCKCFLGSNLVSVTVFEIFRVKILTCHLLTLIRLTPQPKVTKIGDDVPSTLVYHTQKTSARSRNLCKKYVLPNFSLFGPLGANPWAKVQKGEKTWRTPRSTSLQNFIALRQPTPEISVTKIPADKQKNKKQTTTPVVRTGVYTHMPIAVTTVIKDTFRSVFSNTRYKILCMYLCRTFYDTLRHREIQIVYNTGRDRPCGGWFLTRSATVRQVCRTGITPSNLLSIFQFLTLGAYP